MVSEIQTISEAGKHSGKITTLVYDRDHVYSGGSDGVINVWDKNLQFKREIVIHKGFEVLALVANSQNHLYSSGRDGSIRCFRTPWRTNNNDILSQTVAVDVTALCCVGNNVFYSGDDKGTVQKWYNNKAVCRVGKQLQEVKWIAVEGNHLYTVHGNNVVIFDIKPDIEDDSDITRGTIPGRGPLIFFGPKANEHHKYLAFITRDGKGFTIINNAPPFKVLYTEENAHEMIINTICALEDSLFTAGLDGKVKKWINLDKRPTVAETIDTGKRTNVLCVGPNYKVFIDDEDLEGMSYNTVYAGDSEGVIKRLQFNA